MYSFIKCYYKFDNMENFKRNSIILLIYLFYTSSCSLLDKEPLDKPSNQNFPANFQEMKMALAGCYEPLWLNHETMTFFLALDCMADMSFDRNENDLRPIPQGSVDATNTFILRYWTKFYAGISRCNYLIHSLHLVEGVDQKELQKTEGEARFLRALYYSYLVELYGDVPLVTEPLSLENSIVARTPKSTIVDFIIDELIEASNLLPHTNNPSSGHASFVSAMALRARVALFNERWEVAAKSAEEVMNLENTEVVLENEYAKLFTNSGENSKEIIFSVQYLVDVKEHSMYRLNASRNAGGFTNKKPAYQLADSWECIDGLPIDKSPLFNPAKPYLNRDPRLGYTIAVSGSQFLGYQFETHGDSVKCWKFDGSNGPVRVDNLEATHAYATFTGLCWRKYCNLSDKAANTKCETNTILLRYAEVLLTYAEAKIQLGQIDESVYQAVNKVRKRPSVNMPDITDSDPATLLHRVYKERKCELAGEGLRLFDIRRLRIAEKVMNQPILGRMKRDYPDKAPSIDSYGNATYDEIYIAKEGEPADHKLRVVENRTFNKNRDYLWPIPDVERQTNPKLTQNPGY